MRKFVKIREQRKEIKDDDGRKLNTIIVYPTYQVSGEDIMKKGGKFYAILDHETSMWSTEEKDIVAFIDREIRNYICTKYKKRDTGAYESEDHILVVPSYLDDSSTNRLKEFNTWMMNISPNHNFVQLDEDITFKDTEVTPEMYRSKRLSYEVKEGDIDSYDRIMSTLYSDDNRRKIEWAIGSVFAGDSKKIEKMLVLYGNPGSGKSTILDLVKELFKGYWAPFVASELVSSSHQFGTAAFKDNPLVAIQDDGKLSKIETPIINEIVSHKHVLINEKGKQQYPIVANAFMIVATNDPVDIHDTKLGITRRLLDVYPSGKLIKPVELYRSLVAKMDFEIGAIAYHCIEVYKSLGKEYYEGYIPIQMIKKTNYLQNFLFDEMDYLTKEPAYILADLYKRYVQYYEDSGLGYPPKRITFRDQLKDYFEYYEESGWFKGGSARHIYSGLKIAKVMGIPEQPEDDSVEEWISFSETESILDQLYSNQPAQYAKEDGTPEGTWATCETELKDIDTSKLHWFKLPEYVIKIDFDKRDSEGNKSLEENLKAANKFPKTYAEVSKSGAGIHLYYIYDGDPNELSRIYEENVEIKLSTGNNAHRRILTKCNNLPVAHISTGLPLKEVKPKVEDDIPITVTGLKTTIKRCLAKEIHADTRSNVDWIYEVLERAYNSGLEYDFTGELENEIKEFARHSTNQSTYCTRKAELMHFKSKEKEKSVDTPLKGGAIVIDERALEDEKQVRDLIGYWLSREDCEGLEVIAKIGDILSKAYNAGLTYDVSDLRQSILIFAVDHGAGQHIDMLNNMHFKSDDSHSEYSSDYDDRPIVFFDVEVFPNLFVVCWKYAGENQPVIKMINPEPKEIEQLFNLKLIGFNNKDYDNHILYARWLGKSLYELYLISKGIINNEKGAKFREAKNLSYTDIYDFSTKKQSLKKWEIELGIHHQENSFPWDEPVDEKNWPFVADYCANDVIATEAVFNHLKQDWIARQILADLADSNVNESTNNLTLKIVFGDEKYPTLVYTDLATGEQYEGR